MKSTKSFENIIKAHLELRAINDPLFAETLKKENKSIKECILYILQRVEKSGINGFEDNEIYNMAVHYYDEDNIKANGDSNVSVVVNHKVALTFEEIQEAKEKAKEKVIKAEMERLTKKKTVTTGTAVEKESNTLF